MHLFRLLLTALASSPLMLVAFPTYPEDVNELGMTYHSDPSYPPEIGARSFVARVDQADPSTTVYLMYAKSEDALKDLDAVAATPFGDGATFKIAPAALTPLGGGKVEARFILPFRKPPRVSGGGSTVSEYYRDNDPGFYRWIVVDHPGAGEIVKYGSIHAFTMPRRLVFAAMGDSYGSGEGAPLNAATPWITEYDGVRSHRSPISGSELSAREFRLQNPGLAFDYVNTTSSGAILRDLHVRSQAARSGSRHRDLRRTQLRILNDFLSRKGYQYIDCIIASGGGNDLGFSELITNYASPLPRGIPTFNLFPYSAQVIGWNAEWGQNYRPFPLPIWMADYQKRLKIEYEAFAKVVHGGRQGSYGLIKVDAEVRNVRITEYPNLLKGCYMGYRDVELAAGALPILLFIDPIEMLEIHNFIFPQLASGLQTRINQINATYPDASWQYVPTDHRVTPVLHSLCGPARHFVGRHEAWTAFLWAGPERETNAFHPNRLGHRNIYFPAIHAALDGAVSASYRGNQAGREGIKPPSLSEPDLAIASAEATWSAGTRTLSGTVKVRNLGGQTGSGVVRISLKNSGTQLGTIVTPAVGSTAEVNLPFSFQVGDLPELTAEVLSNKPGPAFVPADYETKDKVLSWYFPSNSTLLAEITASGTPNDNPWNNVMDIVRAGTANNRAFAIQPDVSEAVRHSIINGLTITGGLPAGTDPATVTASDIDIYGSNLVLGYFGYCDGRLAYSPPPSEPPLMEDLLKLRDYFLAGDLDLIENVAGMQEACQRDDLRHVTYLGKPIADKTPSGFTMDTGSVTFANADLTDLESAVDLVHPDGRAIAASFHLKNNRDGAFDLEIPTITPPVGMRPTFAGEELPIPQSTLAFDFPGIPAEAVSFRFDVGLTHGGGDLFQSPIQRLQGGAPADPLQTNFVVERIPQDGRPIFTTTVTRYPDGDPVIAVRRFETEWLNARLAFPLPSDPFDPAFLSLSWTPAPVPADAFRVRIGSFPGGDDLYGHQFEEADPSGELPPSARQLDVFNLPRDNRTIHITLSTKRGGVWHHEHHAARPDAGDRSGITYPVPGSALGARARFLHSHTEAPGFFQLTVGSTPGADDIVAGEPIGETDGSPDGIRVDLPQMEPGNNRIWVNLTTAEGTETYPFLRTIDSSLLTPDPTFSNGIRATEQVFLWEVGQELVSQRLVLESEAGLADIYDSGELPANASQATVMLDNMEPGATILVRLISHRSGEEEPTASTQHYAFVFGGGPEYDHTADTLDDSWQVLHFGPDNPASDPAADPDRDGCDNEKERLFGTDPNDPASRPLTRESIGDGVVRIELPAVVTSTEYVLEGSDTLESDSWTQVGEVEIPGENETNVTLEFVLPTGDGDRRFYRLRLRQR